MVLGDLFMVSQPNLSSLKKIWLHENQYGVLRARFARAVETMGIVWEMTPLSLVNAVSFYEHYHKEGTGNSTLYMGTKRVILFCSTCRWVSSIVSFVKDIVFPEIIANWVVCFIGVVISPWVEDAIKCGESTTEGEDVIAAPTQVPPGRKMTCHNCK